MKWRLRGERARVAQRPGVRSARFALGMNGIAQHGEDAPVQVASTGQRMLRGEVSVAKSLRLLAARGNRRNLLIGNEPGADPSSTPLIAPPWSR